MPRNTSVDGSNNGLPERPPASSACSSPATPARSIVVLVQIYSGLVFRGPWLLTECVEEIRRQRPGGETA
jgi:hypothetical protein